jgi:BirA family biotin operon repressor/biotin-[acetyl-CoA-carboxylase] ligase
MIESLNIHGFGLKWPNDLYKGSRKCGGILVETSPLTTNRENVFVIVGTGLNVNSNASSFPEELVQTATSLFLETGARWQVSSLYEKFHSLLLQNLKIHEEVGFEVILEEWRKRDVLLGKEMQWVTRDKKLIIGKGLGPDADGQLLAEDAEGNIHEILSGDVSLVLKKK